MTAAVAAVRRLACPAAVAAMLRELALAHQRTERDVQVAFSLFARLHGLPDGVTFHGVDGDVVLVGGVPEPPPGQPEATG